MEKQREHIVKLLQKHLQGSLRDEEQRVLQQWAGSHPAYRELLDRITAQGRFDEDLKNFHLIPLDKRRTTAYVLAYGEQPALSPPVVQARNRRFRAWLPYAAAVILVVVLGTWFVMDIWDKPAKVRLATEDIAPGGNRATLTLADGRTIDLNEAQTGIIVGERISYLDGSTVLDEQANEGRSERGPDSPHTGLTTEDLQLTTPKGGTYSVTLPDGTKVWLNAASTLTYPSRFSGNERVVHLAGEAYFDVNEQVSKGAGAQKIPFQVISNGQTVEVLGTRFNISAYSDEPDIKTTLVEGSVQVSLTSPPGEQIGDATQPIVLRPGQQVIRRGAEMTVHQINASDYIAWKDGWIVLQNSEVDAVVRQLERWYDVTFEIGDWPPGFKLGGKVQRDVQLSTVLQALELHTGKKLVIEERRVMEKR